MVQKWYTKGDTLVHKWYTILVHKWYKMIHNLGTQMVQQWFKNGTKMVQQWFTNGTQHIHKKEKFMQKKVVSIYARKDNGKVRTEINKHAY